MQNRTRDELAVEISAAPVALPAFEAYRRLRARYSAQDTYLMESLAGDEFDCCANYCGAGKILTMSIGADGRPSFAGDPVVAAWAEQQAASVVASWERFDALQWWLDLFGNADVPFVFTLDYEASRHLETLPRRHRGHRDSDLTVTLYQVVVREDLSAPGQCQLLSINAALWDHLDPLTLSQELARHARSPLADQAASNVPPATTVGTCDERTFAGWVEIAQRYLRAGDIYQAQLGHALEVISDVDPWEVYLRLRARNPAPYMFVLPRSGELLIGASPEMFVSLTPQRRVLTRPIAGTYPVDSPQDLSTDPKELAEHLMLVDLARNDISRIAAPGSLAVLAERDPVRYSHVIHLVSTVSAQLAPKLGPVALLEQMFPAGTMTGAPKIRAMEIIDQLEDSARGAYSGAVGILTRTTLTSALTIRATTHRERTYTLRASAGIVLDSNAAKEWRETIVKMAACLWAVTGEEPSCPQ